MNEILQETFHGRENILSGMHRTFRVTKLIITFETTHPIQPAVKSYQWGASHRLRNTAMYLAYFSSCKRKGVWNAI
jgi:hypothetical protein